MKPAAIHHDHATFRQLLQGMSHPGSIFEMEISTTDTAGTHPLIRMLCCLMDNEVTFSVIGDDSDTLAAALSLHTGSARAGIGECDFVIATRGTTDGQLAGIKRGTLEYPDQGATLVYLVEDIAAAGGTAELSGPGISGSCSPRFTGLASAELTALREVNAEYPLGVDAMFLDAKGRITCIPRSTRIGEN